jgi:16S rRNA G1207 methylase RsmC
MADSSAVSRQAILETYDFSGIDKLADIGGGHGTLLAGILRQYPQMQGVLYDLPEVIATIPPNECLSATSVRQKRVEQPHYASSLCAHGKGRLDE